MATGLGSDPASVRTLVESFAAALDADDFASARRLLDAECVYEVAGARHVGPDDVIASYRAGSDLARSLFDQLEFDHEILEAVDGQTVRVRYLDVLRAGGETFTHISEQDVMVVPHRGVARIVDRHVPGEQTKLDEFMARHGIERPS